MDGAETRAGRRGCLAELIRRIRGEESNVLLLDAGDIFQGTPFLIYIKA